MRILPSNPFHRSSRSGPRALRRGGVAVPLVITMASVVVVGGSVLLLTRDDGQEAFASAEVYQASSTSFEITVDASGELEAAEQIVIRSELEEPADVLFIVPEGVRVQKGDLLVEFASEAFQTEIEEEMLRVEQAKNDFIAAENALEIQKNTNDSAMRDAILKLELARIEYNKWVNGDDRKRREELALNIETSEKDFERAQEKYERSQNLYDNEFLSLDELKLDEISALRAEAAMKKAKLEWEVYEEYEREKQIKTLLSDIEQAEAELDRVERSNASNLASKHADLANRQRSLRIRQERLAKDESQLEKTKIYAPQDGLVVYWTSTDSGRRWDGSGAIKIGDTLRPNEAIMILPDTSRMVASVRVHESLAGRVKPGQRAQVRIDAAQSQVFRGRIESIGVLAESGGWRDPNLREYTVKIALETTPEEAKLLKPSMRCEADIVLGEVKDTLAIPIQAVFSDGPNRFVYVPNGNRFEMKPVLIGQRSNTFAQIHAGIEPGTRVLLREPRPGEIESNEISEDALAALAEKAKELGIPQRSPRSPNPGAEGAQRGAPRAGEARTESESADDDASPATAQVTDEDGAQTSADNDGAEAQVAAPVAD